MTEHEQIEQEVLEAVLAGRWQSACSKALRDHAATCASCSDLALVADALAQERAAAVAEARPPSASLVWWKAQLRARREAAERAVRPVALVERAACAFAIVAALVAVFWLAPHLAEWLPPLGAAVRGEDYAGFFSALFSTQFALATAIGSGLCCLAGFLLYAVFAKH